MMFIYLLFAIYFKDAVSSSDFSASNYGMISE
jgi:hypothetical protein